MICDLSFIFILSFSSLFAKMTYTHLFAYLTSERSHLSAERLEKQAVLYSTARITEARQRHSAMEHLEATGQDAMWGDADQEFDLQLENFGVNTSELSAPVRTRVFHAWIEDWENDLLKNNDCVAEARLLEKYKSKLLRTSFLYHNMYVTDKS